MNSAPIDIEGFDRDWFYSILERDEITGCWNWPSHMATREGYGALKIGRKTVNTHRLSYALSKGTPDGLLVRHTCDNPLCCNPEHLILGTHAQNIQDMDDRGRRNAAKGERIANHVLTDDIVLTIKRLRQEEGLGPWKIADRLGLNRKTVEKVVYGERWRHVTA